MYTIIIEQRGKTAETMTKVDEEIALVALCKIAWPGKPPSYRRRVNLFKQTFHGIARSPRLQKAFQGADQGHPIQGERLGGNLV